MKSSVTNMKESIDWLEKTNKIFNEYLKQNEENVLLQVYYLWLKQVTFGITSTEGYGVAKEKEDSDSGSLPVNT